MPVSTEKCGFGQVIVPGNPFYIVVFEPLFSPEPELTVVVDSPMLLVGWTVDAFFYHKRWQVVGNDRPSTDRTPYPSYKVMIAGQPHARSFDDSKIRPATDNENEVLEYKGTFAPAIFQNALLAHHGVGDWRSDYEKLTLAHSQRRVRHV